MPALSRRERKYRRAMRRARHYVPWNYNPPPRFGLRLPRCPQCSGEVHENPIVHLGGGILAKFGLCTRCLNDQLDEYRVEG
jgi:hypothetical protein